MVLRGIVRLASLRFVADHDAVGQIAHDRRQQRRAVFIGQRAGPGALHGGDQRVGGAQVDAGGQPVLVRPGAAARLGDLQERHGQRPPGRPKGDWAPSGGSEYTK